MNRKLIWAALLLLIGCKPANEVKTIGRIERLDPALDQIISSDAKPEILAEGFTWSEGPVWVESLKMLLFSDVVENTVFKWTEQNGKEVYLKPSGYTSTAATNSKERGSNGLFVNSKGELILCQHGDRRVARMNGPLDHPVAEYTTLAGTYQGKRFNSPNDIVTDHKGNLYFTDPPYGLGDLEKDSLKEIPYQGVYRIAPDGHITLLVDSLTKPNGIALSPDEKFLFVANSDPAKARWYRYELRDSTLTNGTIFYDATPMGATGKGLADGMKIDRTGTIFATAPGGILVFNPEGKLLGKIVLPEATANCALSEDQKTLYITSDMYLLRLKMR